MKTISIKKLSTKLQQYIIKEVPDAKSINYEGEKMSKVTNEMILNEIKNIHKRLVVIEQDIKDMKNTPTMKKELAMS